MPVVKSDREASACGHNQLRLSVMGMAATVSAAGHIIKIENPFYIKGHGDPVFHNGQTALPLSVVLIKVNNRAIVDGILHE